MSKLLGNRGLYFVCGELTCCGAVDPDGLRPAGAELFRGVIRRGGGNRL